MGTFHDMLFAICPVSLAHGSALVEIFHACLFKLLFFQTASMRGSPSVAWLSRIHRVNIITSWNIQSLFPGNLVLTGQMDVWTCVCVLARDLELV